MNDAKFIYQNGWYKDCMETVDRVCDTFYGDLLFTIISRR